MILQPSQSTSEVQGPLNQDTAPPDIVVPVGVLQSQLRDVSDKAVTGRGVQALYNTDEEMIWNASPAALTVVDLTAKWAVGILFTIFLAILFGRGWGWVLFWFVVAAVRIGLYHFSLRSMRYRASTQRLEVTDGLLHQQTKTYEVHHLGDATINSPILLRLFGLSNLTIRHQYGVVDTRSPVVRVFAPPPDDYIPARITLLGIASEEAKVVRDLLRGVGQTEAGRLDKLRFR